jgi:hypothetical protein
VTEHCPHSTGAQRVRVVDAVASGERGHDERERLVTDARPARRVPEVGVPIEECAQAEVLGERGWQDQPGVGVSPRSSKRMAIRSRG